MGYDGSVYLISPPFGSLHMLSLDLTYDRWYYDNSDESYQEIGQKKPNPWGLHDMHGNAAEWTASCYRPYPPKGESETADPNDSTRRGRTCQR